MAYGIIYEFSNVVGPADYDAVNEALGIDGSDAKSSWPAGLVTHAAGVAPDGGFFVYEVWESKAAQEAFMAERLGAALGSVGVAAPLRAVDLELHNHQVF